MKSDDYVEHGRERGAGCRLSLPRQVLSGAVGDRLGHGVGSSLEFQDYREYQPGDDLRRLDWRAYARSDRLTVRLHREEIQPHLDLISDFSLSMTAPSMVKAQAGLVLSGVFAEAALQGGWSVAWHGFGDGWRNIFPKANFFPPCKLPPFAGGQVLGDGLLGGELPRLVRRGIRVVLGDFLWEGDPVPVLRRLAANAAAVRLVAVLSEEELTPPLYGVVNLFEVETGARLDMDVGQAERDDYRRRLDGHLQVWRDAAMAQGASLLVVCAEDVMAGRLDELFAAGVLEVG